jgi:thiol-disulfide isomerase/thioredoxin
MPFRIKVILSVLFISNFGFCQEVQAVYKINDLMKRISNSDTTYILNFWATWCKPCVEELPNFDSLSHFCKNKKSKVILVCLDFKEELNKKVNPFLKAKKIVSQCVLLDEVNGNDFVNKIDKNWSGAIPATLFLNSKKYLFIEKKLSWLELKLHYQEFITN